MNKYKLIPIIISIGIFIIFIVIYLIINTNKYNYSCYDYENDINYTFKTEEEMHAVCDKITGEEEDKIMNTYPIYNDLINEDDSSYAFYPYINDNKTLSIIVTVLDCDNPTRVVDKVEKWFKNHNYNITDYNIEYEYPCNE